MLTAGSLRLENDLDTAVVLVPEDLVSVRGLFQRQVMGGEADHAERVAAVAHHGHQVVDPALVARCATSASLPLVSMDAERAARQIIGAVRHRRAEVILTPAAQLVSRVAGLAPGLTSDALHLVQRLALPAPPGQAAQGGEPVPGHDLEPTLPRKAFDRMITLGRAAATRFTSGRSYLA